MLVTDKLITMIRERLHACTIPAISGISGGKGSKSMMRRDPYVFRVYQVLPNPPKLREVRDPLFPFLLRSDDGYRSRFAPCHQAAIVRTATFFHCPCRRPEAIRVDRVSAFSDSR